ncbi:MAG: hypothetical protein JO031_06030 [Ktedonobacteraceae bacterium]|nr:hypothetical protein [Ktedonobacteraceae bacterium]
MSQEGFAELAQIQYRLAQLMGQDAQKEKEYMACFAETEHFHHVHIYFIARSKALPHEARGPRAFSQLNVDEQQALSPKRSSPSVKISDRSTRRLSKRWTMGDANLQARRALFYRHSAVAILPTVQSGAGET